MPEYKKRKVHRGLVKPKPKKPVRRGKAQDIPMKNNGSDKKDGAFKVVKGRKLENIRKTRVLLVGAALIAAFCIIASMVLPTGIVEALTNAVALSGRGSYPVAVSGSETLNCVDMGRYYYVLTDTALSVFTNNGNEALKVVHGYENPMLFTSSARALIIDQGGNNLEIYNLKTKVDSVKTKNKIITAAICRSGIYAVATESDSYASTVTVYNKNGEMLYEWNSAKDMVNNIELAPSGKKLAVSTVNATGGHLHSKTMVFEYESADPIFSQESDNVVYDLSALGKGFCILEQSKCTFVSWSKFQKTETTSDLELDAYRSSSSGAVLLFNRPSDKSDNRVVVLSQKGEKISEFSFSGIISDIQYVGSHIYFISDTDIYLTDRQGNAVRYGKCSYGCERFSVIGSHSVAVVTDNGIEKFEIENEEKN